MPLPTAWNLLVFRDGRRVLDGRDLLRTLQRKLDGLLPISDFGLQSSREELTEALLRSGELECALADCDACDASTEALVRLTDQLALALAGRSGPTLFPGMLESIAAAEVPERITVSTPEGFCYYA